jgi:hypothetical protein
VDARGDTNGNQNADDDVVVSAEGFIGVGTLSPETRLDIHSATPGAIRIADGTEGNGKILMSDADGKAQWTSITGSWYAALTGGRSQGASSGSTAQIWPPFTFTGHELSPQGTGSVDLAAGRIVVPYTGMYRISINGTGHTNLNTTMYINYLYLQVNGANTSGPHLHSIKSLGATDYGFMFVIPVNAGDVVTIAPVSATTGSNSYHANQYTNTRLHIEFIQ